MEDTLKREIMEESGWTIDNLRLFRINDNPDRPAEDRQNVDIIFIADAVQQVRGNDEEVKELKWFDLESLPEQKDIAFDHGEHLILYRKFLELWILVAFWLKMALPLVVVKSSLLIKSLIKY